MMWSSRVFFSIYMSVVLLLLSKSTNAQWQYDCPNNTMFANNSQYAANVQTLFHYLSGNATNPTGFYQAFSNNSDDASTETIYGSFLCQAGLNASACHDCVATATTTDLPKIKCPNRKVAVIWYDNCMVRYSNQSYFGTLDESPGKPLPNLNNVTGNLTHFNDLLTNMMNSISLRAPGLVSKVATDYVNYTIYKTIYGFGQCTPDLSPFDCNTCLDDAILQLSLGEGARYVYPSCIVRYETYIFFNSSLLPPASQPSLAPPPRESPPSGNNKLSAKVIVAFIILTMVICVLAALLVISICHSKNKKTQYIMTEPGEELPTVESLQYDLAKLQFATNDFSIANRLGQGGFGSVYKGTLSNGQQIAVKRLSMSSSQGVQEFKNEVLLVAKLQHRNLVRLLGFCFEGQEKLLVYEYVPNKSLDNFLFDAAKQGLLDWCMRYKIIKGIARGMLYLHHDSQLTVIHRDLKASNVLLDADMNAKVADFGIARIFLMDQTQDNTSRVVGTYGYMSPEYAMQGQISIKSDVYSFGVLILEIVSGKRNNSFYQSGETPDLLSYAWKKWSDGLSSEFVDPTIRNSCSMAEVVRCIHLALICVQDSPDNRPTMASAVLTLDSYTVTLSKPEAPGFSINRTAESDIEKIISSDQPRSKSANWSVNDVFITEPEPR